MEKLSFSTLQLIWESDTNAIPPATTRIPSCGTYKNTKNRSSKFPTPNPKIFLSKQLSSQLAIFFLPNVKAIIFFVKFG